MTKENMVYSGIDSRDGTTHYHYSVGGISISTSISNEASIDMLNMIGIDTDKYIKHIISRAPSRVDSVGEYDLKLMCDYHGNITTTLELKR
jgi:hypothetical protein